MTEETKQLFSAPWELGLEKRGSFYRPCIVAGDTKIASVSSKEIAKRIAHLPELYDALQEAIKETCDNCDGSLPDCKNNCKWFNWTKLLRKVRDGE